MNRRRFLKGLGIASAILVLPPIPMLIKPKTLPIPGLYFGDGSDGDIYINSTVELSRTMYFRNIYMTNGSKLISNGNRICCSGTMALEREALIVMGVK